MQFFNTLETSFQGLGKLFQHNSFLGTIELQSNLCLHKCWIDQLYYLSADSVKRYIFAAPIKILHRDKFVCTSKQFNLKYSPCDEHEEAYKNIQNRWQMCSDSNYNYGQDKLIWKLNVTQTLLQLLGDNFLIDIPGKLINAQFRLLNLSLEGVCIKYRWESRGKAQKESKQSDVFVLLGRPNGYGNRNPPYRTWFEADNLCKKSGYLLPSIPSQQELIELINFVKTMQHTGFVSGIFIGISQQVCVQTFQIFGVNFKGKHH